MKGNRMPVPNEADVIAENKTLKSDLEASRAATSAMETRLAASEKALTALTELFTQFTTDTAAKFTALTEQVAKCVADTASGVAKCEAKAVEFDKCVTAKVAQLGIRTEPVKLTEQPKEEAREMTLLEKAIELHKKNTQ